MMSKLTIGDVADALGVSKTTVSRAISGKGRISEETTRRVIDYIERHNYRPNVMARGLAQSRTFNIGVIYPAGHDVLNLPVYHRCLQGIGDVAVAAGYDILLSFMEESDDRDLKRLVEHRKVDGVILICIPKNDSLIDYLRDAEVPFVAIGEDLDPAAVPTLGTAAAEALLRMLDKKASEPSLPTDHTIHTGENAS